MRLLIYSDPSLENLHCLCSCVVGSLVFSEGVCYFTHCCDKTPDKKQLKGGRLYCGLQSVGHGRESMAHRKTRLLHLWSGKQRVCQNLSLGYKTPGPAPSNPLPQPAPSGSLSFPMPQLGTKCSNT